MKPTYNTIDDTYQDPYKLGKYSYQNNTTKNPVFIEPWKETDKNGKAFSQFEYIAPEIGDKGAPFRRLDGAGSCNVGFSEENEMGNQQGTAVG